MQQLLTLKFINQGKIMYQPKVDNTQKYKDSQGSHIVTLAKLVLVEPEQCEALKLSGNHKYKKLKPIIISETEASVKEGERFYNTKVGCISTCKKDKILAPAEFKILALPEHFSDKHLQAIVDGKIQDKDEVLVKCNWKYNDNANQDVGNHFTKEEYNKFVRDYYIYLDQQNHITLFPVKQSLEDFIKDWMDNNSPMDFPKEDFTYKAMKATAEWAKNNL